MKFLFSKLGITTTIILFLANPARAYPFHPNPESFVKYMNTIKWQDGNKRQFFQPSGCGRAIPNSYICKKVYVKQTSPMGRQLCEITGRISSYSTAIAISWSPNEVYVGRTAFWKCKDI